MLVAGGDRSAPTEPAGETSVSRPCLPSQAQEGEVRRPHWGGSLGEPSPGVPPFFIAFFRRGGAGLARSRLVKRRLVSAWEVAPIEKMPSAFSVFLPSKKETP